MNIFWRAGLVAALALTGCTPSAAPASIQPNQVVGTWTSPDGGRFHFAENGTVEASDLLGDAVHSNYEGQRVGGSGRWHIAPNPIDGDNQPDTVRLQLDLPRRWGGGLFADLDAPPAILFFFRGDPDRNSRYEFTRISDAAGRSTSAWRPRCRPGSSRRSVSRSPRRRCRPPS